MKYLWNEDKNEFLKNNRNICFENVLEKLVINEYEVIKNSSLKYQHQKIFLIEINEYIYCVPFVIDEKEQTIFLKTIYPSRKETRRLIK